MSDSLAARLRAAGCVFAEEEARLLVATASGPDELDDMVRRRVAGLPLEHVLGWVRFRGLRMSIDPGVFVPRWRTEFLVEQAIALVNGVNGTGGSRDDTAPPVVLDLCCGSGALGAALGSALPGVELHAADIESAAVRCARRNLAGFGGRVYQGDLFEPLPDELRGRVDILAANVPYVPTDEIALMPAEARLHEPRVALDGGADGLGVLRRVAAEAPPWLAPGGHLLVETSDRQAPVAADVLAGHGLLPRITSSDEYEATVVIATAPKRSIAGARSTP
ncbi:MAG TPA: putative protein N(5)-glutamine methyltransferase [Pseudonocardiaceae bacterium]